MASATSLRTASSWWKRGKMIFFMVCVSGSYSTRTNLWMMSSRLSGARISRYRYSVR